VKGIKALGCEFYIHFVANGITATLWYEKSIVLDATRSCNCTIYLTSTLANFKSILKTAWERGDFALTAVPLQSYSSSTERLARDSAEPAALGPPRVKTRFAFLSIHKRNAHAIPVLAANAAGPAIQLVWYVWLFRMGAARK
jgi:hypothetical protein